MARLDTDRRRHLGRIASATWPECFPLIEVAGAVL
jgi:hypothetical protein